MENFKFILSSVFIIAVFAVAGYWAFSTIESGSSHIDNQKLSELEDKNEELTKEVAKLKKEITLLEADKEQLVLNDVADATVSAPTVTTTTPTKTTTVSKNQTLINALQKLADGNIYLKNKSQGAAVGTVQTFLNIYNNTSNKIDNDYGLATFNAVKDFQKDQGIIADGEAGPGTFKKMITWLKSH
ncbi:MAG: peptidoglycan-binding protein [Candidatus Pacebacteria bacterium]|nr:peptidoglycan-binding protein [Candidatus Paceibacterota bacterium]